MKTFNRGDVVSIGRKYFVYSSYNFRKHEYVFMVFYMKRQDSATSISFEKMPNITTSNIPSLDVLFNVKEALDELL